MSIDYKLQACGGMAMASVQIQVMEQHYEIKKKKPRFCPPIEKPKLEQVSSCRKADTTRQAYIG